MCFLLETPYKSHRKILAVEDGRPCGHCELSSRSACTNDKADEGGARYGWSNVVHKLLNNCTAIDLMFLVWLTTTVRSSELWAVVSYYWHLGVKPERLAEGLSPRHCALSLVGEPIMYPEINKLVAELHKRRISTFLVTNAQFPDRILSLDPVTQVNCRSSRWWRKVVSGGCLLQPDLPFLELAALC